MNITVAGIGYVGLANAVLLAQHNNVIALDIDQRKVDLVKTKHLILYRKKVSLDH